MPSPSPLRPLAVLLAVLSGAAAALAAPAHDCYVLLSMTKGLVMGSRIVHLNGVYRMEERARPVHVGFNLPKADGLAASPQDPRTLFIVGLNGVLRSRDGGETWKIMTGWDMTEPKDIAPDPRAPGHFYVGLPDGIAVSRDGGETWQRMNRGITRAYTQTIAVDRTRAGRVLAGTELGIYVSDDGAESWRRVAITARTVNDLKQSPHDPRLFLAATQADGVLRSRDGGETWEPLAGGPRGHTVHRIDFDAHDPRRMLAAGWGCGVQVSEDGGATWSARTAGLPNANIWAAAFDPDLPGRIYAGPHQEAVHVSDDHGATWRPWAFEGAIVWDFAFLPRP